MSPVPSGDITGLRRISLRRTRPVRQSWDGLALFVRDVAGIEVVHAPIRFSVSGLQKILLKDADADRLPAGRDHVSVLWQ